MSLRAQISDQIKDAMRAKDTVSLDALRYLFSLIKNVEIDAKHELNDEEVLKVITTEVKKRKEAISQFQNAGKTEIVADEQAKLAILMKFLPAQLSEEDTKAKVFAIVAALPEKTMPAAMKAVMAELKGQADGKLLSELVKQALAV